MKNSSKDREGKIFKFYPKNNKECKVCGIASFAHLHREGTLPKDFERIEEKQPQASKASSSKQPQRPVKPSQQSCLKHEYFTKGCEICEDIQPPKSSECTCIGSMAVYVKNGKSYCGDCDKEKLLKLKTNNKYHKQGYEDCRKAILNDLRQIVNEGHDIKTGNYFYKDIVDRIIKLIK